jgi:serine/threonine protein kinase
MDDAKEDPWPVELGSKINEGGLSVVYKGTFNTQAVAVKCLRPDDNGGRCRAQMMAEYAALKLLADSPHVNVGSLVAFSEAHMQLVLPYYACDMLEFIMTTGSMSEPRAKILFAQMASAVKHCHTVNVAHGDIKPENFMLKAFPLEGNFKPVVVLIDFGGAGTEARSSKAMCISVRYASPELRVGRQTQRDMSFDEQKRSDVWSLGVTLFCMLHKFLPYAEKWPVENLEKCKYGSEKRWLMSPKARALVKGLMHGDPDLRMTLDKCLKHPWLAQDKQTWLDWGLSAFY